MHGTPVADAPPAWASVAGELTKEDPMTLARLIYASQPFGFDTAMLAGILLDARRCNARDGISGALICRGDLYLQLLEGPPDRIDAAYARIRKDDRHTNPQILLREEAKSRLFGAWQMLDDPARSWMWSGAEVASGVVERATPDELRGIFLRLLAEITPRTRGTQQSS